MRTTVGLLVALLVVLAGVAPAVGATAPAGNAASQAATTAPGTTQSTVSGSTATTGVASTAAPADPSSDRLGWEDGYWYNESISVDTSDGLQDAELKRLVARTMARVEHVRRLEFETTVPVNVMQRSEFQNRSSGNTSKALRTFDNAKFEALLLINESADSIGTQEQNTGSAVLGYYSPSRDEIVIIVEGDAEVQMSELTLAHELTHALQDQHFNLSKFNARTRDQANANSGVVEGDPSYLEYLYSQRCGDGGAWNGTCVRKPPKSGGGSGGGGLANIGVYLVKYQPYADGPRFIATVKSRGGWQAVNALYDNPPASTEQVIDPAKYPDDTPTQVSLEDRNTSAWQRVRPPGRPDYGVVGQAGVAAMFVYPLYHSSGKTQIVPAQTWLNYTADGKLSSFDPLNYDFDYANGWDGDRLHVYENADGETAYVWRLVWDSKQDATEFREGYVKVLDYWGAERKGPNTFVIPEGEGFADAFHVSVSGKTVTITNAPTVKGLSKVRTSVSVGGEDGGADDGATSPTSTPVGTTQPGTTPEPTDTSSPGFGIGAGLVALLAAAFLVARR